MIALAAHDLTYRFPGATSDAVRGVSLAFEPGRIVAVLGASGSGKSTLLACLAGLVTPTRGRVELAGGNAPRPGDVALVFQNPLHQIVSSSLVRELAFSLEVRAVPPEAMRSRVSDAITELGFSGREETAPASLSAGECQRLVLRAVLMAQGPVVLLDEPTTMLDPDGRRAVLAEVRRIASTGRAVGFVTQFPDEALGADHVIELERGSIASAGPPRAVIGFDPGLAPRDHAPLTSAARLARDASRIGVRIEGAVLTIDDLARAIEPGDGAPSAQETDGQGQRLELLGLRDVHIGAIPREGRYLRGITLSVRRADATILVGPTGTGKTTVLLVAAGVLAVDSGQRSVGPGHVIATLLQYPERHFTERCVRDEIEGIAALLPREESHRILGEVGLDAGIEDRSPFLLSVGEQRRLALALQLMRRPDVLIVDEPTAGLDPETAQRVRTALHRWLRAGGALLAATHDEDLVDTLGGTVHVMDRGTITWSGPAADLWEGGPSPPIPPPAWRRLAKRGIGGPGCRSREDLLRRLRGGGVRNA